MTLSTQTIEKEKRSTSDQLVIFDVRDVNVFVA